MRGKRLLIFNIRTDADDHILGFTTIWINALAARFDAVDVITMHQGRLDVADNVRVYSVGRERGYSELRRFFVFYWLLLKLLITNRYSAAFAHMMPLFAAMGAPLLTVARVPVTTWYTQRQFNRQVQAATWFSWRMVSAVPTSFPIETPKFRALGHGIDTDFFAPDPNVSPASRPLIVYVARLTAVKNQHILLDAIESLDVDVALIGDIPDGFDDKYKQDLIRQVSENDLTDRVQFVGAQTAEQVRDWCRQATLTVNLSPVGAFDKAALEGMACGAPTIVTNRAFAPVMGDYTDQLTIDLDDDPVRALHVCISALLDLSADDRQRIGQQVREGVIEHHSLKRLIDRLVSVLLTGEIEYNIVTT